MVLLLQDNLYIQHDGVHAKQNRIILFYFKEKLDDQHLVVHYLPQLSLYHNPLQVKSTIKDKTIWEISIDLINE